MIETTRMTQIGEQYRQAETYSQLFAIVNALSIEEMKELHYSLTQVKTCFGGIDMRQESYLRAIRSRLIVEGEIQYDENKKR